MPFSSSDSSPKTRAQKEIWLALSGGGFRATLFHLGVVKYLVKSRRFSEVKLVSAVSGGSVLAPFLSLHHDIFKRAESANGDDFEREFEAASKPILSFVKRDVRGQLFASWMIGRIVRPLLVPTICLAFLSAAQTFSPSLLSFYIEIVIFVVSIAVGVFLAFNAKGRSELLNREYERLFLSKSLSELEKQHGEIKIKINCTNLSTGRFVVFDSKSIADSEGELCSSKGTSIAFAVTASSAFPPAFPPLKAPGEKYNANSNDKYPSDYYFSDGGVYDNSGLLTVFSPSLDSTPDWVTAIESNAERPFMDSKEAFGSVLQRSVRANDIMWQRLSEYRTKWLEEKFPATKRLNLRELSLDSLTTEINRMVKNIRTDLNKFSNEEIELLIHAGFCTAQKKFEPQADPPNLKILLRNDQLKGSDRVFLFSPRLTIPLISLLFLLVFFSAGLYFFFVPTQFGIERIRFQNLQWWPGSEVMNKLIADRELASLFHSFGNLPGNRNKQIGVFESSDLTWNGTPRPSMIQTFDNGFIDAGCQLFLAQKTKPGVTRYSLVGINSDGSFVVPKGSPSDRLILFVVLENTVENRMNELISIQQKEF